jgi:FAD/FMN-containing dehydrogenase
MPLENVQSWGRSTRSVSEVVPIRWASEARIPASRPVLPFGLGRSYGDCCLNDGGVLLSTRGLDRLLGLDSARGLITCESGVTLGELLAVVIPHGFFLPVLPGTKEVTVGGAIANDIHGKNHHRRGTFGSQVESLVLLRSSGERFRLSPSENPELFQATVGGLGLTGLVLEATLRLRRIETSALAVETLLVRDLEEYFDLALRSDERYEYTVAWIDCLASGRKLGRGVLHCGHHLEGRGGLLAPPGRARLKVPVELPFSPLNRVTLALFNTLYYEKNRLVRGHYHVEPDRFFFPLDRVVGWNRIYGRDGFFQFQSVVPREAARETTRAMLSTVAAAGEGSFLAVLKNFGDFPSPGLLSFPRPGTTLALDFPNRGDRTRRLFQSLHAMVRDAGGRIYPAKDALMSPADFQAQHREVLEAFLAKVDPAFSSSFWRRVMGA